MSLSDLYWSVIQNIFCKLLIFAFFKVMKYFSLSIKLALQSILNLQTDSEILKILGISYKSLLFAYICAEQYSFYPICTYICCYHTNRTFDSNKYLFYLLIMCGTVWRMMCSICTPVDSGSCYFYTK